VNFEKKYASPLDEGASCGKDVFLYQESKKYIKEFQYPERQSRQE
jgi:hypothetical protein